MSDYEQKDMDGVVFEVDKDKLTEEWMAPWSGKAMINGEMYYINMYDNVSKGGKPYRKLKFKPMQQGSYAPKTGTDSNFKNDGDLPW
jgi:hypothetical protein